MQEYYTGIDGVSFDFEQDNYIFELKYTYNIEEILETTFNELNNIIDYSDLELSQDELIQKYEEQGYSCTKKGA